MTILLAMRLSLCSMDLLLYVVWIYHYAVFNVLAPSHILGIKESKLSSLFAYTHHILGPSLLLLLILPTQNNRSVKVLFTHDVWIITVFREGSHVKYSIHLRLILYLPLNPTPHSYCILHISLITVCFNIYIIIASYIHKLAKISV